MTQESLTNPLSERHPSQYTSYVYLPVCIYPDICIYGRMYLTYITANLILFDIDVFCLHLFYVALAMMHFSRLTTSLEPSTKYTCIYDEKRKTAKATKNKNE